MRRREAFVSDVRDHQHGWSPFRARRRFAFGALVRRSPGLPAFASRPATSTMAAEDFSPTGGAGMRGAGMTETQRVLERLVGPSRITSSARRARLAFKCCVNGISVRKLIRGTAASFAFDAIGASPRSVEDTRIERFRPSESSTTTYAGPRPERSGSTASLLQNKECRGSVTVTWDTTRSRIVVLCNVR